jgi:hypothetical protein
MSPTSKTVCILGSKGEIVSPQRLDSSQFLNSCGNNTGNLLFQYACTRIFKNVSLGNVGHDIPYRHDYVNGKHDYLILPSANFINQKFDLGGLVSYLKSVQIPIIPIGLGAQSNSFSEEFPRLTDLPQSIQDLVRIFRERSPVLFVRGEFTKSILVEYGIEPERVVVTGCPSNFIGTEEEMQTGFEYCSGLKDNEINLLVTGDEVWPKNEKKREVERELVSLLLSTGGGYLVQSVEPLIRNMFSNKSCHISDEFIGIMKHIGFRGLEYEPRSYLRLYHSVPAWMFGIRDISLSSGLRLHGNMCSLQMGIPSVWIYHDSRTEELCKTMELPSISLSEAYHYLCRHEYISIARHIFKQKIGTYMQRRGQLGQLFSSTLKEHGIIISHGLQKGGSNQKES